MKYEQNLILFIIWSLLFSSEISMFYLYNTDPDKQFLHGRHDCFHYHVQDDLSLLLLPVIYYIPTRQFIQYCLSSIDELSNQSFNESTVPGVSLTFANLREQNIASDQLLAWSAPIDLIERYQIYLFNSNISDDFNIPNVFYNCSLPYFGSHCQHTFEINVNSFDQVVRNSFHAKYRVKDKIDVLNGTCYNYLSCTRGPSPLCLDWREICDGKIDCYDGVDEKDCWKLELNDECNEKTEYRCHNGAQCIPVIFLFDNPLNPDCLDGSDERLQKPNIIGSSDSVNYISTISCYLDASFRCEERSCRRRFEFACGDGHCHHLIAPSPFSLCANRRDRWFTNVLFDDVVSTFSFKEKCWLAMKCMTQFLDSFHDSCQDENFSLENIREYCPKPYFIFPNRPFMFGHVFFLYKTNRSELGYSILPDFICYDSRLCAFFDNSTSIRINSSSCQTIQQLNLTNNEFIDLWVALTTKVKELFGACSSSMENKFMMTCPLNKTKTFFQCDYKCISTHRLADGIIDCHHETDESFRETCLLPSSHHRFNCSLDGGLNTAKCISQIAIHDGESDCPLNNDEEPQEHRIQREKPPYFARLCDTYIDTPASYIDENHPSENDETNCHMKVWPCNNLYTRCDGVWNCENGEDEVNCITNIHCRSFGGHPCVSPVNNTLFCLPLKNAGDKKLDCRGGADERHLCRFGFSSIVTFRYHCLKEEHCVSPDYMCNPDMDVKDLYLICPSEMDFCAPYKNITNFHEYDRGFCDNKWKNRQTPIEAHLCDLKEYFATNNIQNRPQIHLKLSKTEITATTMKMPQQINLSKRSVTSSTTSLIDEAWYCNRGILIYIDSMKKCLCPPSYFGSRCQNQNQRVSLTLQFYKELALIKRSIFRFIIILIDERRHMYSYDYLLYIPTQDCNIKFNMYLLYSRYAKDVERNYSIHIDGYDLTNNRVLYYASWLLTFPFQFLPVSRVATQLIISVVTSMKCSDLDCGFHGHCFTYVNAPTTFFCRCDPNWSGTQCNISHDCDCEKNAVCTGPGSVCVCPFDKFGSRCYIPRNVCRSLDICANGGQCVPNDERQKLDNFTCLCTEGFSGPQCRDRQTSIQISFEDRIFIPNSILAHFIQADGHSPHVRTTTFKKIAYDQSIVTLYTTNPFHILFVEFGNNYYISIVQEIFLLGGNISTVIHLSNRCKPIYELFNVTFIQLHILLRVKYYHIPCQVFLQLRCFYDNIYMCLCTDEHQANCFTFDHNMTYTCQRYNYCENNGECFQDDPICPKTSMCVCDECFYGSKCQFSTKVFGLSLDAIFGYQIKPFVTFVRQPISVKISTSITLLMFTIGIISGTASTMTFQVDVQIIINQ